MDREAHWNQVYETKQPETVSWYQQHPSRSLAYIRKYAEPSERVIDVGAGASLLIDELLQAGYVNLVALDVSPSAIHRVQFRLGPLAARVTWVTADVTQNRELPAADLWHDRATLHFLTDERDQAAYAALAARTVKTAGHLVIATFAPDGPEHCSGLPVQRHDGTSLSKLFGSDFELMERAHEVHLTPSGAEQRFCWAVFRRRSGELRRPRRSSIPTPFELPNDQPV